MKTNKNTKNGLTLTEMILAMATSFIVLLTSAIVILSGQRCWSATYRRNNSVLNVETIAATALFGTLGRKANKTNYEVYRVQDGKFTRALPISEPEEVVFGNAVEFRYWDKELSADVMKTEITATAYVLLYLEDEQLKADYGTYPPGAIDENGKKRTGNDIKTSVLVQNVTSLRFSHTTQNLQGQGKGSVRMRLTATDPVTGEEKVILAATLLRNVWP
ncbi:MAG: hypothetical protein WCZ89_07445 [Phycisphaerae bacterium]